MAQILIVEDDITFSQILDTFLKKHGHHTTLSYNIKDGTKTLRDKKFDLVLLDYRLPDGTGFDVLEFIHNSYHGPQLPVIIMTSFHDIRTAVKAMQQGAYDYITKPVNPDELLMVMQTALTKKERGKAATAPPKPNFIEGTSDVSQQLHHYIKLVAPTDFSVILQGESGTGKEQVARTIHLFSKRQNAPFVAIDCGALSTDLAASELFGHLKGSFTGALQDKKGQFEAANGGTLFLDEVGNLSYEVQVKLLRALQEREIQPIGSNHTIKVDVRIITATNDNLLNSVKNGSFREDLYHRLNEFKIILPSLQERGEDLQLFVNYFIEQANAELNKNVKGLSGPVQELFEQYEWPGNLRQLKNTIKRAVLLCQKDTIMLDNLPDEMVSFVSDAERPLGPDLKATNAANEKELIIKTLQKVMYNKSKAAKLLNIDRKTLYYKIAKYNINS